MIDVPEGQEYGFPRELPPHVEPKDFEDWIVDCGYPRHKLHSYGDKFLFTCWIGE
jgi:hypothetical protein